MNKLWSKAVLARIRDMNPKKWMTSKPQASLGVEIGDNCVYMALVEEDSSGRVKLLWQEQVVGESGVLADDMTGGHEESYNGWSHDDLLELACLKAVEYLPDNIICCLALGEDQVYYYERFFPEMETKQLQQAARLDFVAASAWQDKFYCSYQAVGQGMVRIGGIKVKDLEKKIKVLKKEYGFVQGVLVCHGDEAEVAIGEEDFKGAIYAAVCGLKNQGIVFRPYKEYICHWNWLHLTQALWGAFMIALAIFWGVGYYIQQDMEAQTTKVQSRLQLMSDIDAREKRIAENKNVLDKKNQLLSELSKVPHTGQGLLVRLGRGMEEGVWLTEVKTMGDGIVSIQGRSALYGHISAMLDNLNSSVRSQDDMLSLENADMGQDGRIDFRIRGRV